ncbi:hypothetical protein [Muricoccus vinaceus]|uniref:Capsular biosynthesis protein n=1 Tax=Muricoccus vinaceus TaxID=424704 RepID=A0ABV6IZT6_9PROT
MADTLLPKVEQEAPRRLSEAVKARETIAICGPSIWERIELVELMARSISPRSRVLVMEDAKTRDPRLSPRHLPLNRAILNYNVPESPGTVFEEIARAALGLSGDYLIIPNLSFADFDVFNRLVAPAFDGLIVALDLFEIDPRVHAFADVVVGVVSNKVSPAGIGDVYAKTSLQHSA